MNKFLIIFIFPLISAVLFKGCDVNELDEPTKVQLQISMGEFEDSEGPEEKGLKRGKPMQINGGRITIESIEFDGSRENAKGYYFSRSFENGLVGNLSTNELNTEVSFDVPQGVYNPAEITLNLKPVDSSHSIILHGKYNTPAFEETHLEFAFFNSKELITTKIQNAAGNKKVLFKKGKTKTLDIQINLNQLFRNDIFNPNRLEEATVIQVGDKRKIIISPDHNEELYDKLVGRIDKSIQAVLK